VALLFKQPHGSEAANAFLLNSCLIFLRMALVLILSAAHTAGSLASSSRAPAALARAGRLRPEP
jgi:hypothetical protein